MFTADVTPAGVALQVPAIVVIKCRGGSMRTLTLLVLCLSASPSFAQVYIGGTAGVNTSLVTSVESVGQSEPNGGGTTPTFSARAGLNLGPRWGAELEAAYSLTLDESGSVGRDLLAGGVIQGSPFPQTSIISSLSTESEHQTTSINALAWVSYPVTGRMDLVLVGGAAFNRTAVERRYRYEPRLPGFPPGIFEAFQPPSIRVVSYDVGPLVGIETRISLGDRLRLVPGLRLSGAYTGWAVRPTVGVAWMF